MGYWPSPIVMFFLAARDTDEAGTERYVVHVKENSVGSPCLSDLGQDVQKVISVDGSFDATKGF